jgi:hypothetical protein
MLQGLTHDGPPILSPAPNPISFVWHFFSAKYALGVDQINCNAQFIGTPNPKFKLIQIMQTIALPFHLCMLGVMPNPRAQTNGGGATSRLCHNDVNGDFTTFTLGRRAETAKNEV